jgi:type I restriction-modification system DNA methylase subunit
MSETRKRLTELRRHEQELRNYSSSSRWYTGTGLAIKYIELAETATTSAEGFRNAWYAIYNLYMMTHKRGESENIALSGWIEEAQASQKVRTIVLETPTSFLEALMKAQNSLLFDAESKKPRDAKQFTELWLFKRRQGRELSPEKACPYLFFIGRDLRNAISHPKQDPNAPTIKKALKLAADIFLPLAIASTEAMIERPPEGTTGRATAYRSFLYPFLKNSDSPFSDYYLERLFPDQELDEFAEGDAKIKLKEVNKEVERHRSALVRADTDETFSRWCVPVLFPALGLSMSGGTRIIADDGVFEPIAVIKKVELKAEPRAEYKSKDAGRDLACLIWVLPWSVSLDAVSRDQQSHDLTVMEVIQRALTRADVDWAILTNGQQVRLLSKATAHKPRSFLEIDLLTVLERRNEREAQLAFRYVLGLCSQDSLVEKDADGRTRLERAVRESERHGKEISDELKRNVFNALEELGIGFLEYLRSKPDELEAWRQERAPSISAAAYATSQELMTDIYQESLSLMYRLLFLFYAESRDLLPMDQDLYRDSYSLESIRDDIISTRDDPDPKRFFSSGSTDLWGRLKELSVAVNEGWRNIIPAYNGGLFDPEQHEFLERFKINDARLASAVDLLSRTRPGVAKGEGRKKVTYRDLEIRHLGSIYEGILEYHADIADKEKAIVKRGTSGKAAEEYVNVSDLTAEERKHLKAYREAVDEDEENPAFPRGCKVTGLIEQGKYYLIFGGLDSKRKSSGSYYTPDYIVQYIVENTLGPLVRGENRLKAEADDLEGHAQAPRPLSSDEILDLSVLDPAMGSGHFLVAATEYLARAYGAACIREGKDKDGAMSDEEFVHYKRIIAERCVYGVDINPMAVELAKVSMWLFTMHKGQPLSFLNHHLKSGNALLGAWIRDLGQPPDFDRNGKPKKRKQKDSRTGNLFELRFRERVPIMVRDIIGIMSQETASPDDVRLKKALDRTVESLKGPFKGLADLWVGIFFGEDPRDYYSRLSELAQPKSEASDAAITHKFFHWELEFPEVWFDQNGRSNSTPGFSAIIGNPPYIPTTDIEDAQREPLAELYKNFEKRYDLYALFLEQECVNLLSTPGAMGHILAISLLNNVAFTGLRRTLTDSLTITKIDMLGTGVFEGVMKDTLTLHGIRPKGDRPCEIRFFNASPKGFGELVDTHQVNSSQLISNDASRLIIRNVETQVSSVLTNGVPLRNIVKINQGLVTGADEGFILRKDELDQFDEERRLSLVKPYIRGEDVQPFKVRDSGLYVLYLRDAVDPRTVPNAIARLRPYKDALEHRRETQNGVRKWFALHWPRDERLFRGRKVLTQAIRNLSLPDRLIASFHEGDGYANANTNIITTIDERIDLHAIVGLLNSDLLQKLFRATFADHRIKGTYLEQICIPLGKEDHLSNLAKLSRLVYEGRAARADVQAEMDAIVLSMYGMWGD